MSESDTLLIERIRRGEEGAWQELIERFEGRLLAFAEARLRRRDQSEDVVQETFVGFLTSLPNYDSARPLEGYLFSIAAHKLTDVMRRQGRRPTLPLATGSSGQSSWDFRGPARAASSIARSQEREALEAGAIRSALTEQIAAWKSKGQWAKLKCAELLFVCGRANQSAARELGLTEQAVANHKFEFLAKVRGSVEKQGLSEDVFPELYQ